MQPNKDFEKIFNAFRRQGLSEEDARRWALEEMAIQKEWAKATRGVEFKERGRNAPEDDEFSD